tara:strand:- start:2413 stop:3000 length:588 start_codon:yes stop_codon:yes gene_type:complete
MFKSALDGILRKGLSGSSNAKWHVQSTENQGKPDTFEAENTGIAKGYQMTDKARQRRPLNSPLFKGANPSYHKIGTHEFKPKVKDDYAWMAGNSVFRRYANGVLDYQYAVSKLFEALERLRDGGLPNDSEKAALSLIVPGMEKLMDKGFANVMLKLSREEKTMLKTLFMANHKENLNYNAGRGGGSIPGRTSTIS